MLSTGKNSKCFGLAGMAYLPHAHSRDKNADLDGYDADIESSKSGVSWNEEKVLALTLLIADCNQSQGQSVPFGGKKLTQAQATTQGFYFRHLPTSSPSPTYPLPVITPTQKPVMVLESIVFSITRAALLWLQTQNTLEHLLGRNIQSKIWLYSLWFASMLGADVGVQRSALPQEYVLPNSFCF
jgi:hypothetical protein